MTDAFNSKAIPTRLTYSIVIAASFCHMLHDIMQSLLTSHYPLLKQN